MKREVLNRMLSQDEVNQLIANHMNIVNNSTQLTDIEKNTLIEIVNASFESSIHVLQNWTDKKISITKSVVELTNYEDLIVKFPIPYVVADITYKGELSGKNLLLLKSDDIKTIDAIFSGEEVKDKDKELDQLQLSNITGVLDKMSNTAASSVSKLIHTDLGVDNLVINIINFKREEVKVFSTLRMILGMH